MSSKGKKRGIECIYINRSTNVFQILRDTQNDNADVSFFSTYDSIPYGCIFEVLAAMTCVECGVAYGQVDRAAICEGYKLAFPENVEELEEMLCEEDEYSGWSPSF